MYICTYNTGLNKPLFWTIYAKNTADLLYITYVAQKCEWKPSAAY